MDQRIHFALVCGAKSCPPIKVYTATSLHEGLESATMAFCEGEAKLYKELHQSLEFPCFVLSETCANNDDATILTHYKVA